MLRFVCRSLLTLTALIFLTETEMQPASEHTPAPASTAPLQPQASSGVQQKPPLLLVKLAKMLKTWLC
jgi:hypothetical protein